MQLHLLPSRRFWFSLLVIMLFVPVFALAAVHERELPLDSAWAPDSPTGAWLNELGSEPEKDRLLAPSITYWWLLAEGELILDVELVNPGEELVAEYSRRPVQLALAGNEGSATRLPGGAPLWTDDYGVDFTPPRLLHGQVVQGITIIPLRGESGRLYGLKSARLRLSTGPAAPLSRVKPLRPDFPLQERILSSLGERILNPESLPVMVDRAVGGAGFPTEVPSIEGAAVDMVIVTVDSFADLCQEYADHKTEYGTATVVRSLEWISERYPHGSDRAQMLRNFVRDAYEKWSIEYLLIVADAQEIPPRYAYTEVFTYGRTTPTDFYFACLDGEWNADNDMFWAEGADSVNNDPGDEADFLPEIKVGRMPASNRGDCQAQLDKSTSYHKGWNTPYQDRFLMMGEVLFPLDYPTNPVIITHGAWACESIFGNYTGTEQNVVRLYESADSFPDPDVLELTTSAAFDSMDNGFNIVLHNGHGFRQTMSVGSGSLENGHISQLSNRNNFFLLYMINCTAAAFDFDCLAEAFQGNPIGGSFSVIGSVRESFPNVSGKYMDLFFNRLFNDKSMRMGDLHFASMNEFEPLTIQDNGFRWAHQTLTLLGDPSNWLHYEAVSTLSTNAPGVYSLASGPLTLTVMGSGSSPVEHATVCIRKGDEDYQRQTTDAAGQVTFDLNPEFGGTYQLRVEARDHRLLEDSFIVTEPGSSPWLSIADVSLDDLSGGPVQGNGNGIAERGETVRLSISIGNEGGGPASNVTAQLGSTHPGVLILDDSDAYGMISSGNQSAGVDGYLLELTDIEDDAIVDLLLSIASDETNVEDDFYLEAAAPLLTIFRSDIDDQSGGDGDGDLEVGETAQLDVALSNYGRAVAQDITAWISVPAGSGLLILQGTDNLGDLAALTINQGPAQFNVRRVSSDPPLLDLHLTDLFGRTDTLALPLDRPLGIPDAPVVNYGTDASRLNLGWMPTVEDDAAAWVVLRSDDEGGPYSEVSEHWVISSFFEASGLAPYSAYWFKVQPLSAGGLLGTASPPTRAHTNPDFLSGWPVVLGAPTTSTPLIADVDGDQDFEIFIGSDLLYGFNPDGTELADGDDDPKTTGPVSPLGESFSTAIAAADLTDSPGLEVVAGAWNSLEVYVFEFELTENGTEANLAPGWPQSVTHFDGIWSSPSLGDIDGDNDLEIIITETGWEGNMMAWHHDGSEFIDGDDDPETHGVFHDSMGSWPRSSAAFADIEPDGIDEIFVGSSNGWLHGFNRFAEELPGFPFYAGPGGIFSSPSIGDIDGDEKPEIVFCSENDSLYVLDHDGTRHPGWPIHWRNDNFAWCTSVALADLTGDGLPEIFAISVHTREYMKVAWFDSSGVALPGWPADAPTSSQSSPVVVDLDDDGDFEVILGDEFANLLAWHHDGSEVDGFPILTGDYMRGTPTLADLNQDGLLDMALAGWDMNLYVWTFPTTFAPDKQPWYTFMHDQKRTGNYHTMDWIVSADEGDVATPGAIRLDPNWPNPFNPTTHVRFMVPEGVAQRVRLSIHDIQGRLITELVNDRLPTGVYQRSWDGRDATGQPAASGIYFARLQMEDRIDTRKMTLLK